MYHRHEVWKRRVALVAGGVYCLSRAVAYVPDVRAAPLQEPIVLATAGEPWLLWVYVAAWAAAGVYCLTNLPRGHLLLPLAITTGLMCAWGTAWAIGAAVFPGRTYWQTAFTYYGPAVLVMTLVTLTPATGGSRE